MEKFDFSKIEDQKKFDNLPEKKKEEIVNKSREEAVKMEKKVKSGETKKVIDEKIKETKIILTEVEERAKDKMIDELLKGYHIMAVKIKNESFSHKKEVILLPEVQQTAMNSVIKFLLEGSIYAAIEVKNEFLLKKTVLSSEVQRAATEMMLGCVWDRKEEAKNIQKEFFIPKEILFQKVKKNMIYVMQDASNSRGAVDAVRIKKDFSLPKELLSTPEVQQAINQRFIYSLTMDNMNWVGKIEDAVKMTEEFSLTEEFIQSVAKEGMIKCLSEGRVNKALEIKDKFSVSIQLAEIMGKIPEIKEFAEKIKKVSPDFYEQIQKSFDLLLELFEFKDNQEQFFETIKENLFLLDAVAENTRFGSKLLLKFPQLGELSQQNIEFLFNAKKEILKENPDIDPESLEFRQLMQEKLKNYEENQEILTEMKKNGINIDEWLNYQETRYFSLESGKSKLAFSETVSTPLNRIKETINSYSHQIKEILKEYKQELSGCQIPIEDSKEIEDKIVQMREEQEKARAERNEKKAQGIQKGIDGLTQKLANLKTVSSWDKVLGDINAFDQLKNDVFGMQEKLIQAENEFAEKTSGKTPSGKEIQEAKQKIAKIKEELRNKFELLENRIENFKTNLPNLIEPALGKERTEFLIQEIETNLVEQFDHYNTDRSDLANLFSEKSDKEKDKMDSQPMSIFVWARNPDIDLYQGNYSDCCIKINSEHMGAESTIADYNTDLGVQIVNIWDETKNEPVTAAWCWLGKNEKGETSLVVDNIESNTLYSSNYSEQLTEELFDYLKDYAKAIGVKKVVLGKANNDLPTGGELAKLIDDKSEYGKIGGYNRADGYFLEAEENKVKIIWEAKQKESKNKAKGKNKITEVEFTEANARDLSENDFETIKRLERKVYRGTDLIQGQAMIEDIKSGKGLDYSTILYGKNSKTGKVEAVGYIVAVEDETDEGDKSVYLEDIAVLPEAQRQGLGWKILKELAEKLKAKSAKEGKPVLFDMHLKEDSQRLLDRHRRDLEEMGVKLIEEALVADYYDEGEDALYQVYEVKND